MIEKYKFFSKILKNCEKKMQRTHGRSKELLNLTYLNDDEMIKLYGEPTQGFKNLNKNIEKQKSVNIENPSKQAKTKP